MSARDTALSVLIDCRKNGAWLDAALKQQLARDRLNLLVREWWENLGWGNEILELLKDSRLTQADGQALASYLTGYIRKTAGVTDVRDVAFALEGRRFSYSCLVECAEGTFELTYGV
jgi:hypothetical protein